MKKLTIEGIICVIPLLLMVFYYFIVGSGVYNLIEVATATRFVVILWIISIIYFLLFRKDYSFRKSVMISVGDDDELFDALIEEYGDV